MWLSNNSDRRTDVLIGYWMLNFHRKKCKSTQQHKKVSNNTSFVLGIYGWNKANSYVKYPGYTYPIYDHSFARTDARADVRTYGHLLGTTVLIFRLKIPNKTQKYPTSASNLLGTYFGHLRNKWQVLSSCLLNICPFVGSGRRMSDGRSDGLRRLQYHDRFFK